MLIHNAIPRRPASRSTSNEDSFYKNSCASRSWFNRFLRHVVLSRLRNSHRASHFLVLVFLFAAGTANTVHAQFYRYIEPDGNYYEMRKAFLHNYPGPSDTGEDEEATEFTQFLRWDSFWGPRLYPHGEFSRARRAIYNYNHNDILSDARSQNVSALQIANWQELGPSSNTSGALRGVGQIHSIVFDPIDPQNIMYAASGYGGLWKTIDAGGTWFNMNTDYDLARLGVSTIAVDPNPTWLYAGTGAVGSPQSFSDGVYRSKDSGATWQPMNAGLFNPLSGHYYVSKLLIDPTSNVMFAATSIGLYRTLDRKASSPQWTKVYPAAGAPFPSEWMRNVVFSPTDPTFTVLYASGVNVIKSTNGGSTWTSIATTGTGLDLTGTPYFTSGPFAGQYMGDINIAISADNVYLYASILTRGAPPPFNWNTRRTSYFFQYNIASQVWIQRTSVLNERMPIAVDPTNNQAVLVGDASLMRTVNGGASWGSIPFNCAHSDYQAIAFAPYDPDKVFVGTDGGIWKFSMTGASPCIERNQGLGVALLYHTSSSVLDPYQILCGTQDMATYYYKNNVWEVQSEMWGDGFESTIDYVNPEFMYGTQMPNGGNGVFYRATTAINPLFKIINALPISCSPPWEKGSRWGAPLVMDPDDPNVLYQGRINVWTTSTARMASNDNQCSKFNKISDFQTNHGASIYQAVSALAVAPSDPAYIYAAVLGDSSAVSSPYQQEVHLYMTRTGGGLGALAWEDITPPFATPLPGIITGIAISHTNPEHVWISLSGYTDKQKVYRSSDAGSSWADYSTSLPNLPVNCIVYENGLYPNLYVGTDVGVYYNNLTAAKPKWESFRDGLPNVPVSWLDINYCARKIRAATWGRGLWEGNLVGAGCCCTPPPSGMAAWWTLDEAAGPTALDSAGSYDGVHVNAPSPTIGIVDKALSFDGVNDYVSVPNGSGTLGFGNLGQNFSIDAWVKVSPGNSSSVRPIVDKRLQIGNGIWGYSLFLYFGRLGFQMGDGGSTNYVSNANAADGLWHHVAVTVDRSASPANQVILYVDGQASAMGMALGNTNNSAPLLIGKGYPILIAAPYFKGTIDEVEIFGRALTQSEVQSISDASSAGKCKHHCSAEWESRYCLNTSTLIATMQVCNDSGLPQTYSLSFAGAQAAGACSGPALASSNFVIQSPVSTPPNSVTVMPGECVPVKVEITSPPGLIPGQHSCYTMTARNDANGHISRCSGSVIRTNHWCWPNISSSRFEVGRAAKVTIRVENTGAPSGTLPYTFSVRGPDMAPDMSVVRLNGLPPGTPVQGVLNVPIGQSVPVDVEVEFIQHVPFASFDLVAIGDEDGDGIPAEVMFSYRMHTGDDVRIVADSAR